MSGGLHSPMLEHALPQVIETHNMDEDGTDVISSIIPV